MVWVPFLFLTNFRGAPTWWWAVVFAVGLAVDYMAVYW
jgi:hypothetical protein